MATAPKRIAPMIGDITSAGAIPMPQKVATRGSKTEYPFDKLTAVGMSFPVMNKTAEQLASIVSNQNRKSGPIVRNENGSVKYKTVAMTDASGVEIGRTVMKNAKGKPVPETNDEGKPHFSVFPATKDDPVKGAKSRVFRDA